MRHALLNRVASVVVLASLLPMAARLAPAQPPAPTMTERALQLRDRQREAFRLLDEFHRRRAAGELDEADRAAKQAERAGRELIAGVEQLFPGNRDLAATFRRTLASLLAWQADRDEERDDLDAAEAARREVVAIQAGLAGEAGGWEVDDARRLLARTALLRSLAPGDRRALAEARALNRDVLWLVAQGKWADALAPAREALEARGRILGQSHPDYAASLANLAGIHDDLGDHARAGPLYRRALEVNRKALGERHPEYARSLNNLAVLYHHEGDYVRAEPFYRRAIEVWRQLVGEADPDYAASLGNLAALYRDLGQYRLAEPLAREALDVTQKALGEDDPAVAGPLNNLAAIHQAAEDYPRAEPLYRRVVELRRRAVGERHPAYARSLNNLAALHVDMGDLARAEPLFREARDVWRASAGEAHPEYARSVHNLAGCYLAGGDPARAEPLLREARRVRTAALGERHPLSALTLEQLALAVAAQGRWEEAAGDEDRARRALRWHVRRALPSLSARDQLAFLRATDLASLNTALSLGLARRDDPAIARLSAGWVLNGKGAIPESLAEQSLLAREADDPEPSGAVRRLQEARAELARAIVAAPGPDPQSGAPLLERLVRREEELAAQLARSRGPDGPGTAPPWVEVDAVREALPAGSVLVEVAKVAVYDFRARAGASRWLPPRYAAWLIPRRGEGDPRVVDLGESEPIDAAVVAFREAMRGADRAIYRQGEARAEADIRATLEALARRVLRPIEPALGPARLWFVSPDSALWLVPWGALPLADGRYSVEAHTIRYLVSGRDLVARDLPRAPAGAGLLVDDPDFELAARPRRDEAGAGGGASPLRSGDTSATIPASWPALPGTADEAATVLPRVRAYLGAEPAHYTGADAVEGVVKAARRPRMALLCTHGFFLPDRDANRPRPALGASEGAAPTVPIDNPLLRCGLVFAGANRRDEASDPNGDDGILTGIEVLSADLRGTELVVLSACETGLGSVLNGQGVAGLRQAFHLAGARAVIASLWKVPDAETADLMGRVWEDLAGHRDPAEALHEAQRSIIRSRRESEQAAHPLYWAAFTLTGRVAPPAIGAGPR